MGAADKRTSPKVAFVLEMDMPNSSSSHSEHDLL
jgi:hypothetical protein